MSTVLTVQFVAEVPISFVSPVLCSDCSEWNISIKARNEQQTSLTLQAVSRPRFLLRYQRLTWEHFIKISLHFNSSPLHRKQSLDIPMLSTENFQIELVLRVTEWTGCLSLLCSKLLPNLLDLLISPNRWIISMKKLWDFTRDFGPKEVII